MKTEKRKTKQVRVGLDTHRALKFEATNRAMTISRLLDEICKKVLQKELYEEKNGDKI